MSVKVRDMVIASVSCKGVFGRFAALSEDEQADVVSRVKKKLNGGGDEAVIDKDEASDGVLDNTDDNVDNADVDNTDEAGLSEEDMAEIDGIHEGGDEDGDEGGDEDAGLSEDDIAEIDGLGDEVEGLQEGLEEGGESPDGMMGLVDGLVQEVEQIKSDGKIEPSEVLGLFDNMMQMVTLLVNTRAPVKSRKKG
jgi:hypothetical protein